MTVYELIEILKKCDPSAYVNYRYPGSGGVDTVSFIEFNATSKAVFLYDSKSDWEGDTLDSPFDSKEATLIDETFAVITFGSENAGRSEGLINDCRRFN